MFALNFPSRLLSAAICTVAMLAPSTAPAQTYPDRPVRIVVGFPPGQASDLMARAIAQHMSVSLGQQVFVENKPGAAGIIGTELVKSAKPDGYTLLLSSSGPMAINPSIYKKLTYDPVKDFTPVGQVVAVQLLLAVNPGLPVNNVREFVDYVKANAGKVSYGSGGSGITAHLAMEAFKSATGIVDLPHIPYKGSPAALTDLMADRVVAMFDSPILLMPHHRSGKIKLLGVGSKQRLSEEPGIPTIAEQGVEGFTALSWGALFAPANTPKPIIDKLNAELNKALRSPAVGGALAKLGAQPSPTTPEELAALLRNDLVTWDKAAKQAGLQVN